VAVESLRGKLLVASPVLLDPNFARTVLLVAEHTEDGAMAVVLNRPSEANVTDAAPELAGLVDAEEPIHVGGPVQPLAVTILAEFDVPDEASMLVFGRIGFLKVDEDMGPLEDVTARARVFAGYAGWGAGQLEEEMEREDWIVADPDPDDVLGPEPQELWSDVLERMGGRYTLIARMPLDPSVN
jgi:putative transcriptional regulator